MLREIVEKYPPREVVALNKLSFALIALQKIIDDKSQTKKLSKIEDLIDEMLYFYGEADK